MGLFPQASGSCGTFGSDVRWEYHEVNSTLTISGRGSIKGSTTLSSAPWSRYAKSIHSIVIQEGITHINEFSFRHLSSLENVTLPDSLMTIGDSVFFQCESIREIHIPAGVTKIGYGAFSDCSALEKSIFPQDWFLSLPAPLMAALPSKTFISPEQKNSGQR